MQQAEAPRARTAANTSKAQQSPVSCIATGLISSSAPESRSKTRGRDLGKPSPILVSGAAMTTVFSPVPVTICWRIVAYISRVPDQSWGIPLIGALSRLYKSKSIVLCFLFLLECSNRSLFLLLWITRAPDPSSQS